MNSKMIYMEDPRQLELFDLFESDFSPCTYLKLVDGFYGVFRATILALMPADELAKHFSPSEGRPTKELYSMAGLILLKEFNNWTIDQTVNAYLFDRQVHFALNMRQSKPTFCTATLERYMKQIREDGLAAKIYDEVTQRLIVDLELNIEKQRLDSTHFYSDMATFARTKLLGVAILRFLVQLKRHHEALYLALPAALLNRYEKKQNQLFADAAKDSTKRSALRNEVAREMYDLIQSFSGNAEIEAMTTYKKLVEIFNQQCEVKSRIKVQTEEKSAPDAAQTQAEAPVQTEAQTTLTQVETEPEIVVEALKKTGGNVIQNPSDDGATYDGKKGPGYQVQLVETCHADNPVQLITCTIPQTAAENDSDAVIPVLDQLIGNGLQPKELFADTAYGGDDNVTEAAALGTELIAPVAGSAPMEPAIPEAANENSPAQKKPKEPTDKQKRLETRRKREATEEWRSRYKARSPIEGTNSAIKRRLGLQRLRVRGRISVYTTVHLKIAGWNISRAAAAPSMRAKLKKHFHLA